MLARHQHRLSWVLRGGHQEPRDHSPTTSAHPECELRPHFPPRKTALGTSCGGEGLALDSAERGKQGGPAQHCPSSPLGLPSPYSEGDSGQQSAPLFHLRAPLCASQPPRARLPIPLLSPGFHTSLSSSSPDQEARDEPGRLQGPCTRVPAWVLRPVCTCRARPSQSKPAPAPGAALVEELNGHPPDPVVTQAPALPRSQPPAHSHLYLSLLSPTFPATASYFLCREEVSAGEEASASRQPGPVPAPPVRADPPPHTQHDSILSERMLKSPFAVLARARSLLPGPHPFTHGCALC